MGAITAHSVSVRSVSYRRRARLCCRRVVGVHMARPDEASAPFWNHRHSGHSTPAGRYRTGSKPAAAASAHGIDLEVVKAPEAKRGFVLLPRRWVVERSFAWATRCRRLVKDYERYASTLAGLHMVAFVCLMLRQAEKLMTSA
ncbi:transposase IS4 [Methylobacterium sp. AMS5]|nr:transposase IS4 [Methylobacterium sp. AMS5]